MASLSRSKIARGRDYLVSTLIALTGLLATLQVDEPIRNLALGALAILASFVVLEILRQLRHSEDTSEQIRDQSRSELEEIRKEVIRVGQLNASLINAQKSEIFGPLASESMKEQEEDINRAAQGTYQLFNRSPSHMAMRMFRPLRECVAKGGDWDTVTRPGFWGSENMGDDALFRDAQVHGAAQGSRIRRVLLMPALPNNWVELIGTEVMGALESQDGQAHSPKKKKKGKRHKEAPDPGSSSRADASQLSHQEARSVEALRIVLNLHVKIAERENGRPNQASRPAQQISSQVDDGKIKFKRAYGTQVLRPGLRVYQLQDPTRLKAESVSNFAILGEPSLQSRVSGKPGEHDKAAIRMLYTPGEFQGKSSAAFSNIFLTEGPGGQYDWQWSLEECRGRFESLWQSPPVGFKDIGLSLVELWEELGFTARELCNALNLEEAG